MGDRKYGLLARYVGMKVMFNSGVKYIYNEALNTTLIGYYSKLGFRLGKFPCDEPNDPITKIHEKRLSQGKEYKPRNYIDAGYKMKFCSGDLTVIENDVKKSFIGIL